MAALRRQAGWRFSSRSPQPGSAGWRSSAASRNLGNALAERRRSLQEVTRKYAGKAIPLPWQTCMQHHLEPFFQPVGTLRSGLLTEMATAQP